VLPKISMRNYLGLAMRGTVPIETTGDAGENQSPAPGYGWSRSERRRLLFQEELHASVRQLRKEFHINGERIFLAGAGDGGTLAWDLFLARPEWFAGVAVLDGHFPWHRRPLRRYHELRGKHVFLATDAQDSAAVTQAEQVGRLLYTAGLEVSVRCHVPGPRRPRSLMRNIDYWIMQSIGGCR
jgi:predicted esterase